MEKHCCSMESPELEDNLEHQETPLTSDVICDDPLILCPRMGSEYQAVIPNVVTEDERHQLMSSPLDSCSFLGYDYPVAIGRAMPIRWASCPPNVVNTKEEQLHAQHASETEAKHDSIGKESQMIPIDPTTNNTTECDSTYQDAHPVVPVNQFESASSQAHDAKSTPCSTGEHFNFGNKPMMQPRETEHCTPLPGSSGSFWSDVEAECFLLGLYIFGKNFSLVSKLVQSKMTGDILSYYYGKFYKKEAYHRWSDYKKVYHRWSDCKKMSARRCILGQRIFTGWRQQELISRLKSTIPKEAHGSLLKVFKFLNEGRTSFEEFVFTLKSTVGTEAFVVAVGIVKGKCDLTGVVSAYPEKSAAKAYSSLSSEDITKFLTGDFRLSKTRLNDIFWEAVWPRLLARGWHSEKPKDVRTTKNYLVFLAPGIKNFSRRGLTKGTHYFDSVSDVLKMVAVDPILLELDNGVTVDNNGWATGIKSNQDGLLNHQNQANLQERPKFTIVDTSLVQGEEPFKAWELRSLPDDANVSFGSSHQSDNTINGSSSEMQDADDRSSDIQEESEKVTANVKDTDLVSVYNNTSKETQIDSLQNRVNKLQLESVVPANGHSSDKQHTNISNGKGDEIDSTPFFGLGAKSARHEYLSPLSKRRRLAGCSNNHTSRRSFSFSKGDGLSEEKMKPLSSSPKPVGVDIGDTFQSKTSMDSSAEDCATKEWTREQVTNAMNSSSEDKPHEEMVDAVDEVPSEVNEPETKVANKGAEVDSLIDLNKPDTPLDDGTNTGIWITSSENNSLIDPDLPEAAGRPVGVRAGLPLQIGSQRQGTRIRAPTAKALEAVASGLLGGGAKRKSDPKSLTTSKPPQRARKSTKNLVSMPTSTD